MKAVLHTDFRLVTVKYCDCMGTVREIDVNVVSLREFSTHELDLQNEILP